MEISCSQVQNLVISLYSSATQLSSHWEQIYLVNKMLVLLTKKKIQIKLLVLFEFCKKASHFAFIWNSPRCWADLLTPQSRKAPSRASSSVLITFNVCGCHIRNSSPLSCPCPHFPSSSRTLGSHLAAGFGTHAERMFFSDH